jgi:hypothetical protein
LTGAYILPLRVHPRERIAGQTAVMARQVGDRRNECAALSGFGSAYKTLGDTHRAIEHYEQALVIARETLTGAVKAMRWAISVTPMRPSVRPTAPSRTASRASGSRGRLGNRRSEGAGLANLGHIYAALGEPRRAINVREGALPKVAPPQRRSRASAAQALAKSNALPISPTSGNYHARHEQAGNTEKCLILDKCLINV